jgi:hypothetical protein
MRRIGVQSRMPHPTWIGRHPSRAIAAAPATKLHVTALSGTMAAPLLIIGVQSLLSFIAFGLIARWHLIPWLSKLPLEDRLLALTWLHVFRYVALTGWLPGQVSADVPAFALDAVVYGDTISALLALVSVIMLRARAPGAIMIAWVFNVVGLLDWAQSQLVGVSAQAFAYPAGASALVYAFYVPLLVVTHVVMLYWLFTHRRRA